MARQRAQLGSARHGTAGPDPEAQGSQGNQGAKEQPEAEDTYARPATLSLSKTDSETARLLLAPAWVAAQVAPAALPAHRAQKSWRCGCRAPRAL
eukprot:3826098-Alexandrium_andersonii.AAC.1